MSKPHFRAVSNQECDGSYTTASPGHSFIQVLKFERCYLELSPRFCRQAKGNLQSQNLYERVIQTQRILFDLLEKFH